MPTESFPFKIHIAGEKPIASSLPKQITKKQLLDHIQQRYTDPYVQREMLKYFSKFPSNSLNHMVSRLNEIATEFERKRNASNDSSEQGKA